MSPFLSLHDQNPASTSSSKGFVTQSSAAVAEALPGNKTIARLPSDLLWFLPQDRPAAASTSPFPKPGTPKRTTLTTLRAALCLSNTSCDPNPAISTPASLPDSRWETRARRGSREALRASRERQTQLPALLSHAQALPSSACPSWCPRRPRCSRCRRRKPRRSCGHGWR